MNCSNAVKSVLSVSRPCVALAMPKSITFGTGTPSFTRHEDVRRLEVAVDDALLVRVLHGLADLDEQLAAARAVESWFSSQYCVIGTPRTSSITK